MALFTRSQMAHLGSEGAMVALDYCQGGAGLPLFVPTKETPSRFSVPWHVGNYSSQRLVQVPVLPRNKVQQVHGPQQNYVVSGIAVHISPGHSRTFSKIYSLLAVPGF